MIFSAFQREDSDNVFSIVRNVSGGTISAGAAVVYDVSTNVDGVRVSTPATATLGVLAGITDEAIANSAYGRVQKHGYKSAAYVLPTTNTTITAGTVLYATNAQTYLSYGAAPTGAASGLVFAAEDVATATTPAAATKKVLIRAL